ncbi:hypothetical protein Bbelb_386290 [Branchiostoma belcheri]|nr:hypothetical protein Bbelb_386290 [Branchiostoma belcheri]
MEFAFATWNVRGLTSAMKRQTLGPRLQNHVIAYGRVSDRIATLDLSLPLRNGRTAKCRIVNVYGPTTEKAQGNPLLVEALATDTKSTTVTAVFNQIDYVLCKLNCKPLLKDSHSYGGTDLNSDHKPVVTHKRLKELEIKRADDLADEIPSTDDCNKMFRAARALGVGTPTPSLLVHNTEGHFIATDKGKADAIREWFLHQFTDPDGEKLDPFQEAIGEGTLIALPKPKKPPGPPANLRPITLLNSIRKTLSTVALHRIRDKIDNFTGPYQSGFERGRSCADIVWAQRMLVSVVLSKHWDFHKMEVLDQAGCNNDELRLVRLLLSGTKLKVRVRSTHSADFETSIGSPQGDSLSPVLFTCYLSAALETVRRSSARPNPPVSELGMPLEMEYTDDVDFLHDEKAPLERL